MRFYELITFLFYHGQYCRELDRPSKFEVVAQHMLNDETEILKVARYLIILLLMTLLTFILTLVILITSGKLTWTKTNKKFLNKTDSTEKTQGNLSEKQELFLEKLQSFQKYLQTTRFSRENTIQTTTGYYDLQQNGSEVLGMSNENSIGSGFDGRVILDKCDLALMDRDNIPEDSSGHSETSTNSRSLYWEEPNFSIERVLYPKTSLV